MNDRAKLARDVDDKRRSHRMAAQKFGAMANAKINHSRLSRASLEQHEKRVGELAKELHDAARAMVRAEQQLEDFNIARRAQSMCAEAV